MTAGNIVSFIVLGKEAAAAGRPRDGEVALLMACRLANRLKGSDSVESANANTSLAGCTRGSRWRAAPAPGAASCVRVLNADRLRTFQARHGPAYEKTCSAA